MITGRAVARRTRTTAPDRCSAFGGPFGSGVPRTTAIRLILGEVDGCWGTLRRGLDCLERLGPVRVFSERVELECGRIKSALGRLIEHHRLVEASKGIEFLHPRTCDLNDVERRTLLLLKSIIESDWTLSEADIRECRGILSQLPDLGFERDQPIDRLDCRYDARSRIICWFGREIQLTEKQCLLVEHAWKAWEESDGWFSKQSAKELSAL